MMKIIVMIIIYILIKRVTIILFNVFIELDCTFYIQIVLKQIFVNSLILWHMFLDFILFYILNFWFYIFDFIFQFYNFIYVFLILYLILPFKLCIFNSIFLILYFWFCIFSLILLILYFQFYIFDFIFLILHSSLYFWF